MAGGQGHPEMVPRRSRRLLRCPARQRIPHRVLQEQATELCRRYTQCAPLAPECLPLVMSRHHTALRGAVLSAMCMGLRQGSTMTAHLAWCWHHPSTLRHSVNHPKALCMLPGMLTRSFAQGDLQTVQRADGRMGVQYQQSRPRVRGSGPAGAPSSRPLSGSGLIQETRGAQYPLTVWVSHIPQWIGFVFGHMVVSWPRSQIACIRCWCGRLEAYIP